MKKVAYFTNIAPHYREKLWLDFAKNLGVDLHFYFGQSPHQSIAGIDFNTAQWSAYKKQVHQTDNIKIKGRLIYQSKVIRHVLFKKWDCIILLGDANIISNWLLSMVAKVKGIPVIFWGHGIYGNEPKFKKFIRKTFLSLADINLVYGHWARNIMIKENFKPATTRVIYNSVNYEISRSLRDTAVITNFYHDYFQNELPTLIFIGRLTKVKRLHLLIEALHDLNTNEKSYNLILIGDGEARQNLEDLAHQLNENIYFYGACYEEEKISKFLANAALCVSPGNVGLTSIHAMSYGTPVCTNNDFKNQMPEFEAIKEWETGCFFDKQKENLAETISTWFRKAPQRNVVRENCFNVVDEFYNPINQVEILKQVLDETFTPKVAFFTNIAPHYRERLWLIFAKQLGVELHFYFGENPKQSIATINFESKEWKYFDKQIHRTANYKINKRLIYQKQVLRQVIFKRWDAVILLGDANIISNWLISFIAKLRNMPVIFWGHGIYGNEKSFKKWIRKNFLKLADYNLVYGHWAKNLLEEENFDEDKIKVIYNSVNYETSKPLRGKAVDKGFYKTYFNNDLPTLIFIGRLTEVKKLHLLIMALAELNTPRKQFNLMVVGDGEVKADLESLAKRFNQNVYFYGACYDETRISKFMANADLCVSPGNVGLTSVHAMSYGTPVCTSDDFKNQGPEFEAVKAGITGCFFDSKQNNLAKTISEWFEKPMDREQVRANCYKVVDTYYNPEVQLNVLKSVLDGIIPDHHKRDDTFLKR